MDTNEHRWEGMRITCPRISRRNQNGNQPRSGLKPDTWDADATRVGVARLSEQQFRQTRLRKDFLPNQNPLRESPVDQLSENPGLEKQFRKNLHSALWLPPSEKKRSWACQGGPTTNRQSRSGSSRPGESDPGPHPIPNNLPIEGWPSQTGTQTLEQVQRSTSGGDRHSILIQPGTGFIWETWQTRPGRVELRHFNWKAPCCCPRLSGCSSAPFRPTPQQSLAPPMRCSFGCRAVKAWPSAANKNAPIRLQG